MTPADAQLALAAFDGLLTTIDFVSKKIQEAHAAGLITKEEQDKRLSRIAQIETKVGF